jgi:3-oxoacyl-[acyl-carrier-protein] synthase III
VKIQSLAVRLPSKRVTNEELVELVRASNLQMDSSTVERYCRQLRTLLLRAGASTRVYRNREAGETAIALIGEAIEAALRDADIGRERIELLIYCGVGRGFVEPANACFIAHAMGLECDGFDVLDACMSWVRALHIAYNFLATGAYSTVMIVNGEFSVYENGLPQVLQIRAADQLRYMFPAFTIGEAASATVLTKSPDAWQFTFRARPELAHLCSIALPGFSEFAAPDDRIGVAGLHQLAAFGPELAEIGLLEIEQLLRESIRDLDAIDLFFPHTPGQTYVDRGAHDLKLGDRVVRDVFPACGNLVSASIPAAMRQAIEDRRLERGQRLVLCPASAGMTFATVEFVY